MQPYESPFHEWLDRPAIRELIDRADRLEPSERLLLIKDVVLGLVDSIGFDELEEFLDEVRVKALLRIVKARAHLGTGHASRVTPGGIHSGPTSAGHQHRDTPRDLHDEGGRDGERALDAELSDRTENEIRDDDDALH